MSHELLSLNCYEICSKILDILSIGYGYGYQKLESYREVLFIMVESSGLKTGREEEDLVAREVRCVCWVTN